MNADPAVEAVRAVGVTKTFPGIKALDDVTLGVRPGEIHVLVGENGAGKSTLVKVLSGVYAPDAGRLEMDGAPVDGWNADRALRAGVRTIFQEFNLIPHLTVMENVCLGSEPVRRGGVLRDMREMYRQTRQVLEQLGVDIDPRRQVGALGVAEQQLVEIAKGLRSHGVTRLMILDEPTAALSMREAERLFEVVRSLTRRNIGVLYITHRFEELSEIGDRITVMRDGAVVDTLPLQGLPRQTIVRLMVGDVVDSWTDVRSPRTSRQAGDVAIELRGGRRHGAFDGIDLQVRWGQIVGLFGLIGAGRTELARALMGVEPLDEGTLRVRGTVTAVPNTAVAFRLGMGMSPEDRKRHGIVPDSSVLHNVTLGSLRRLSRWGIFVQKRAAAQVGEEYVRRMQIRTVNLGTKIKTLSGGNQQKVILARLLCAEAQILIFDEPTRGIDVGAKREVYGLIEALAEAGHAVLIITSELDEALTLPDELLVMREGRMSGHVDPAAATRETVLDLAFPAVDATID